MNRASALLLLPVLIAGQFKAGAADLFRKWSPIELRFEGPESEGRGAPNPFAIPFDIVFTSPEGKSTRVPGFYDGDGKGGLDGHSWKVRFSADAVGIWSYRTSSEAAPLDAKSGKFTVGPVLQDAQGFWKWGRLEHPGTSQNGIRYFKFRDGPFWLKAGCDDPENFLGNYRNYDSLSKRKGAIDYLAGKGINSLYIMTHNLDGDDKDVWPWLGATANEAKKNSAGEVRFDIAKLTEWRKLLEYMQERGVVPYLILEDDSAWKRYDHARYHREMIARFGDLPAVIFNLGEEHNENYSLAEGLAMARSFRAQDPYDHPLGIHNVNRPHDDYIDSADLDFTAIQTGAPGSRKGVKHATEHNAIAHSWIDRCSARERRVLMVNFDEGRPELDRRSWWSAYLAGGVWEAHVVEPYDQPHSAWENTWRELGGARAFMESLPFWKMQAHNELITSGMAFCLAHPGEVYAIYLPEGGAMEVALPAEHTYQCDWWNPANGKDGRFQDPKENSGGTAKFTAPTESDWALRILRKDPKR